MACHRFLTATAGVSILLLLTLAGCRPKELRLVGSSCNDDSQCESGVCIKTVCQSSLTDFDHDGLSNGAEKSYYHTDPSNPDTDGDGVDDGREVKYNDDGTPAKTPPDDDGDGIINALESKTLSAKSDPDHDCIPNQMDPQNNVPDHSDKAKQELKQWFCLKGICKNYADHITAECVQGQVKCDFSAVPGWEAVETECDGLDNDCDGHTDEGLVRSPATMDPNPCPAKGVCAEYADSIKAVCKAGKWTCDYSAVQKQEPAFEPIEVTCDGLDNDCDGMTDEIKPEPGSKHRCKTDGVCGGDNARLVQAVCIDGWKCDYSQVPGYQATETLCDDLDNDCNGKTDELWPDKGAPCTVGKGACKASGKLICSSDHTKLVCSATPGTPADKDKCGNNKDDDCNGVTDDYCGTPVNIDLTVNGATRAGGDATVTIYRSDNCGHTLGTPALSLGVTFGKTLPLQLPSGGYCMSVEAKGYERIVTGVFNVYATELRNNEHWPIRIKLDDQKNAASTVNVAGRMFIFNHNPSMLMDVLPVAVDQDGNTQTLGAIKPVIMNGHYSLTGLPLQWSDVGGAVHKVQEFRLKLAFDPQSKIPDLVRTVKIQDNEQGYPGLLIRDFTVYPDKRATCFADGFENMDTSATAWGNGSAGGGLTDSNVYWQPVHNDLAIQNVATEVPGGCVVLSESEQSCEANDPQCCKCASNDSNACIPKAGALPYPYEGRNAMWFGNIKTGNYMENDGECSPDMAGGKSRQVGDVLETNDYVLDLTRATWSGLSFWTAFEVEGGGSTLMDQMTVFLQDEDGNRFNIMNLNRNFCAQQDSGTVCTSGQGMPCWRKVKVDISMYNGKRYKLGFAFDSGDGMRNAYRGWMIDDIRVSGIRCLVFDDDPQ